MILIFKLVICQGRPLLLLGPIIKKLVTSLLHIISLISVKICGGKAIIFLWE